MNETRSPKLFMGTGLVFGACSMLVNVLSFATPYWLQVWPRIGDTTFRSLGLWQVCISGFRNYKDMWGKVFHGCWWIFAREYDQLRADGILTPPWFVGVQTLATFAFITNALQLIFLVVTVTTNFRASVKCLAITATLGAITCFLAALAVTIFGIMADTYEPLTILSGLGYDMFATHGKWMPRPEYTFLSWSYICEVFCAIFSLISCNYSILTLKTLFSNISFLNIKVSYSILRHISSKRPKYSTKDRA